MTQRRKKSEHSGDISAMKGTMIIVIVEMKALATKIVEINSVGMLE